MIPGSKGLKSHEIAHKWENALLTPTHVIRIKQNVKKYKVR